MAMVFAKGQFRILDTFEILVGNHRSTILHISEISVSWNIIIIQIIHISVEVKVEGFNIAVLCRREFKSLLNVDNKD